VNDAVKIVEKSTVAGMADFRIIWLKDLRCSKLNGFISFVSYRDEDKFPNIA